MSLIQVGLLDKTGELDHGLLHSVAAALNLQVTQDLPQFWNIQGSVSSLPKGKVASGVWPGFLVKQLPPGEGGFHLDKHNQPYAEVIAHPENDGWKVAASHEVIEMLVDPNGNRLQSSKTIEIRGGKIRDGAEEFGYLVEACHPCEADESLSNSRRRRIGLRDPSFLRSGGHARNSLHLYRSVESAPGNITGSFHLRVNQQNEEWQQLQYVDPKTTT